MVTSDVVTMLGDLNVKSHPQAHEFGHLVPCWWHYLGALRNPGQQDFPEGTRLRCGGGGAQF